MLNQKEISANTETPMMSLSKWVSEIYYLCLETVKRQNPLEYSKNLVKSPVSGHFPYSKVFKNSETTKSLEVFKEFGQFSCF